MKKTIFCITTILMLLVNLPSEAKNKKVSICLLETTDVHGSYLPYDFINRKPKEGSLARVSTYVNQMRDEFGKNVLLMENGDLLQGQPTCYYYNYIATDEENIAASITNYMGYDVQNFGNHDTETGHAVYDKWVRETKATVLGANIIDTTTGKPYVKPYEIFERDGVKIAVLGMQNAAIPSWLGENLWSGLHFDELIESARYWVNYIQENEKPDLMVGLFHSGKNGGIVTEQYSENVSERVAKEVAGFDIIFFGHDHIICCEEVEGPEGKKVWLMDPANNAMNIAKAIVTFNIEGKGKKAHVASKEFQCENVSVRSLPIDQKFMDTFAEAYEKVNNYVNRSIGTFTKSIHTRDSFFGSAAFTDLIQNMQMKLTGAQVSFNAPLAFNATIAEGELHVSDMFNLYKYENMLVVMRMTGDEIRRHLEMSYDNWINTMQSPDDHIMRIRKEMNASNQREMFVNPTFNFDSAAGIDYVVDVTKPKGEKVQILQFSDGKPFDLQAEYSVAMNSYRANGGGELLTRGAGIPKEELQKRIIWQSDKDLRFYLMQEIERQQTITPEANNNWRFVPEEIVTPALERDRKLLFSPLPTSPGF